MAQKHQDQNILLEIYMQLRSKLGRAVLGIVPPREIEDVVQETYVRACQATAPESIKRPDAYLFRIARNLALDYAKKAENRLSVSEGDLNQTALICDRFSEDPTLDAVISDRKFASFCEAIRRLPLQQRRAFVLKKVYGYTQREIASKMQLSEKTIERHISLGMERCMEYMSDKDLSNNYESAPRKENKAANIASGDSP